MAFYTDGLMRLIPLDLVDKDVFIAICKHADPDGWCRPGDQRLADLSQHRRDAIPDALARLQAAQYIHIELTPLPHRQKPERDIQISPHIMRLRPEFQRAALEAWERFDLQTNSCNKIETVSITYGESDRQPDQIQKQIKDQIQNPIQNSPRLTIESKAPTIHNHTQGASGADQVPLESEGQTPEQDEQETHAAFDTRSEAGRTASASAPFRREPPELARYARPLADEAREEMALNMVAAAADLSQPNARMLVDTYGAELCGRVLQIMFKTKHVSSPARFLRAMLRKLDREEQRG